MTVRSLAAVLVMVLCACAPARPAQRSEADPLPTWVSHPPEEAGVLYAVGAAARGDHAGAVAAARSELASEIAVSITSEHQSRSQASLDADSNGRRVAAWSQCSEQTQQERAQIADLTGVVIRRTEDGPNQTWALVSLDRSAWARGLEARLQELDRALVHTAALSDSSAHPVAAALRRLQALGPLERQRAVCADQLRLARPDGVVPPAAIDLDQMRHSLAVELSRLPICIQAEDASLAAAAREACAALQIDAVQGHADLELALQTADTHAQRIEGEWRLDGQLRAEVRDTRQGRSLGDFTIDARASGLDEQTARRRLAMHLASALAARLDTDMLTFLARW